MVIKKVENKLEKLVEGTFAKFFSSELKPVEISRKIVREIELNRSIGVHGDYLAPNNFDVVISESDYSNFIFTVIMARARYLQICANSGLAT